MPNLVKEKSMPVRTAPESPWKQKLKKSNKDELISFLVPPKTAKSEYEKQETSKYVFKCLDGDIQIPEYGIRRTDFYYKQSKAREVDENGHIFNYLIGLINEPLKDQALNISQMLFSVRCLNVLKLL